MTARKVTDTGYYSPRDVAEMMEVSERKAYDIIKVFNEELEAMGKFIRRGRVRKTYFHHRTDVNLEELKEPVNVKTKGGFA